jgi:nucleotide-binding universal stress UspA family protein
MFQRILVPLDGSRLGGRALKYATPVAKKFNAELSLLQVVIPSTPITAAETAEIASPVAAEMAVEAAHQKDKSNIARARRYLRNNMRRVTEQGVKASRHVAIGEPAEAILRVCRRQKADLIVMTTHGKSGLKRAILGSVADKIIRESGIPVMVIRPRGRQKK